MVHTGGCRCGELRYRVRGAFGPVVNCHCAFCRRVHGAAFTSVAFIAPESFEWLSPPERAARWTTPLGSLRHFCGQCAAPLYNFSAAMALGCVIVNSLDADPPAPWLHVNLESMAPWHVIGDDLPRFQTGPTRGELLGLVRAHPGAWFPTALVGAAPTRASSPSDSSR